MSKIYTILMQGVLDIEADDDISQEALFILAQEHLIQNNLYELELVLDGSEDLEDEGGQDNE